MDGPEGLLLPAADRPACPGGAGNLARCGRAGHGGDSGDGHGNRPGLDFPATPDWDFSGLCYCRAMTADLTILPVGSRAHLGTMLADVLKEIRRQGLVYQLTGTTTCLEGSWEQITAVAKACHDIGRKHAPHIVTLLRIEDDIEGSNDLQANVETVEKIAGEKFNSNPPIPPVEIKVAPAPAPVRGV